ncbi:ArsR/SmtB family transcription factor [Roseovarius sp. CH_XMU1461]|uniref:ArsR/SmtB family transcription factor n=1 Tax=Roseovarius sp. CH_XMU1461 TaxID=3107777 RepID=UPI0030095865
MKNGPDIAPIAALIGDPARANMLTALMSGKALTVSELAAEAGVTLQTTSSHLARLEQGGLVRPRKSGRHKYFALTSSEVAHVLEALMGLASGAGHLRSRTGPRDAALRKARSCYNHLAGDMGTKLYDGLLAQGLLIHTGDQPQLTEAGHAAMTRFGIDMAALTSAKTPLCRDCLDWSERRSHLAGSLGRALLSRIETRGWAKRVAKSRVIRFSPTGEAAFLNWLAAP